MQNRWTDSDAAEFIRRFADAGEDLALRVYTSRLIGGDPALVMHGGGNTSVKSEHVTLLGDRVRALYVKGSGWNLDSIEPKGLPGLDLDYLLRLRHLDALTDEDMVNELRTHMFDASAPNPSIETLLHAFLPAKFVDHSHADSILAITNRPGGMDLAKRLFGERFGIVAYVKPGFDLSKLAAETYEAKPDCEGLVLYRHGLFTFADDAKTSYDRHIAAVTRAEEFLEEELRGKKVFSVAYETDNSPERNAADAAMLLRGCLAVRGDAPEAMKRWVLHWRCSEEILNFANSEQAAALCATGPLTPDHIIRTKQFAAFVPAPEYGNPEALKLQLQSTLDAYAADYHSYYEKHAAGRGLKELDPLPRVVILPGAGMIAVGASRKEARVAADLYEHTIHVKSRVQAAAKYETLSAADLFEIEYWSLEQAKLGKGREAPLARQVAVVTGAGGAIGRGIALKLAEAGAHVALVDVNLDAAKDAAAAVVARFGKVAEALPCDVTDRESVAECFDRVNLAFGGFDILVPNAGIAYSSPIADIDPAKLAQVMDVNFTGYFNVVQEASRRLIAQGTGGHIILNSSKNVFAPGKEFAAYSASKAAGHQLGKIAALELAAHGIRVNMINADAVFSHGETPSGLWRDVAPGRAKARNLSVDELFEFYRERNLLKAAVTAEHVGNAVVFFATNQTPTTGATLPVDGGLPEAFPR